MKKYFLLSCCVFFFVNAKSQDSLALVSNANEVYRFTMEKKFDSLIETTYSQLFNIVPKKQMLELITKAFAENDDFSIEILNIAPEFSFGNIISMNNQYISKVQHNLGMKIIFKEKIDTENVSVYINEFKKSLNSEQVFFDEKTNTFTITKRQIMIALNDKFTEGTWKFLNYSNDEMLWKVIDPAIKTIIETE